MKSRPIRLWAVEINKAKQAFMTKIEHICTFWAQCCDEAFFSPRLQGIITGIQHSPRPIALKTVGLWSKASFLLWVHSEKKWSHVILQNYQTKCKGLRHQLALAAADWPSPLLLPDEKASQSKKETQCSTLYTNSICPRRVQKREEMSRAGPGWHRSLNWLPS